MPLTDHALTTYETVQAVLQLNGSAAQTRIENLIDGVSRAMELVANRHFERGTVAENYRGFGDYQIIVRRAPVTAVGTINTLNIDGTVSGTLAATGIAIDDPDAGILFRSATWPCTAPAGGGIGLPGLAGSERRSIQINYTAGWITPYQANESAASPYSGGALGTRDLPDELEQACIMSVVHLYRRGPRSLTLQSQTNERGTNLWVVNRSMLLDQTIDIAKSYWRPANA